MELSIENEILDFILLSLFKTDPSLIVLTQLGTLRFFAKAEQHNSIEFFKVTEKCKGTMLSKIF